MLRLGPDPDDVVALDDLGEARILAEEAVARVDRIGVADLGRRDDRRDVQIGFARRRRPDADRLVGEPDVHGIGVGGRMDRDRLDAHLMARAVDAKRYLTAVRNKDFPDRHYSIIASGCSYSTGCASWTRIC